MITHQGGLRDRPEQCLDRGSSAVGVEVGDEFGDQDDHHQDRACHVFTAEHGNAGGDGDKNFRTNLSFVKQVGQSGFDQWVDSKGDCDQEHWQWNETLCVEQDHQSGDEDTCNLDPAFAGHQGQQ